MEYVQGKMLKELIEMQGRLQPDRAVDFAIQISAAINSMFSLWQNPLFYVYVPLYKKIF